MMDWPVPDPPVIKAFIVIANSMAAPLPYLDKRQTEKRPCIHPLGGFSTERIVLKRP